MEFHFYGWETADRIKAKNDLYSGIDTPLALYQALTHIWCADTCAPRMRSEWTEENKTLGQCSITAFLVQDIFGGDVYGLKTKAGSVHCYNVVDSCIFDLTSEQFGEEAKDLVYAGNEIQYRDSAIHFQKEEKKLRYEYLKQELQNFIFKEKYFS